MHDYAGAVHFHSAYSYDARTPVQEIVHAALAAGLHFAVLTDHFKLDARTDGWEGYHGSNGSTSEGREHVNGGDRNLSTQQMDSTRRLSRVPAAHETRRLLLIVGEEISPRYNHYLAFNTRTPIIVEKDHPDAQRIIDAVKDQGGFGFIAHPDHEGAALVGSRAYPWLDWNVQGFTGLGIWDLISDWSSSLKSYGGLLKACLFPARVLRGPRAATLARWDQLAQAGRCVAIGEVDNHGNRRRFFGLPMRVFPFEFAFRTVRTHVLLESALQGEAEADRQAVLSALRKGRSYVSLDYWQDPTGFEYSVFDQRQRAFSGDEFIRKGPALLEAKLPGPGRLRLVRNGRVIYEERRRSYLERDLDLPGVYRIEADQHAAGRWRPWIFSNPIWVH